MLFRNARVFDGQSIVENTDVLIQDGRIARVGRNLPAPAGAQIIDARGQTLLPGLIDSHTHVFGTALRQAVIFGVTTELDMFTDPNAARVARAEQRNGQVNDRLSLSEGTVRNYLSEAIAKLGAGNRVEAARIARDKGWL